MLGKGSNRLGAWARWGRLPLGQNQNQSRLERRRRALRLAVEPLEDRTVLTTMLVVNSLLDDGTAGTLRAAIEQANSGADNEYIIQFDPSAATGTISLTQGTLWLQNTNAAVAEKAITIDGPGASQLAVSGNNANRVFHIQSDLTATLEGLTITQGQVSGGGISNNGTLTVTNSIVSRSSNGGISSYGALTIVGSTIINNSVSSSNGGGISNNGALMVIGSTITQNSASNRGGGIYNSFDGTVAITDSTISRNSAIHYGGGIYNLSGAITVTNSTITRNSASIEGGGIYSAGISNINGEIVPATVTITNSTVSVNGATYFGGGVYSRGGALLTITDSNLNDNHAGISGGSIYNNDATTTITNSTLSGNEANDAGGGIFNNASLNNTGRTVTITNSTLSNNEATVGGGIYNSSDTTVTITNSTFSGNKVTTYGGGIYNDNGGTVTATNSTLSGNSASRYGGGIFNNSVGTVELINTIVAGNQSPSSPDIHGDTSSQGHNLIGDTSGSSGWLTSDLTGNATTPLDPLLGPLQNNGGPTQTMALLSGSPAIDTGAIIPGLTTDQRGFPRPQGAAPDIGAYESPGFNFVIVSGGNQSTAVDQSFTQPLVVRVIDQYGSPVPNIPVTFAAPETGPGATFGGTTTFVVTTDAAGLASAQALANSLVDQYMVTATASSVISPALFALTNTPGDPAQVIVLSGTPQTATVETPFDQPLLVRVTDQYGNPVPGVSVTFAAPETGPGATFGGANTFIVTTDAAGLAAVQALANSLAGQYGITATTSGMASPALFVLTNEPPITPPVFPTVVGLERFGVHRQPTRLVLSFSEGLDPARAANLQNYVLVHAGRDGVVGTRDDRRVRLRGAVYHSANGTVSLRPAQLLSLRQRFTLTVRGTPPTGLANPAGVFLAGNGTGQPGTDYVTTFGGEILSRPEVTNNSRLRENARRAPRNGQRAHPSLNTPQRQAPGGPRARLLARFDQARHNSPRG